MLTRTLLAILLGFSFCAFADDWSNLPRSLNCSVDTLFPAYKTFSILGLGDEEGAVSHSLPERLENITSFCFGNCEFSLFVFSFCVEGDCPVYDRDGRASGQNAYSLWFKHEDLDALGAGSVSQVNATIKFSEDLIEHDPSVGPRGANEVAVTCTR